MAETEQQILARLGVPGVPGQPGAPTYVLIYDQAAHCDYDWTQTFKDYYTTAYSGQGVAGAVQAALTLIKGNPPVTQPPCNYYSMCEMDFLRNFVEKNPTAVAHIKAAGQFFRIVGGGITSPDNMLCSGEGFIRNYLVGKLWLAATLPWLLPLKHCWIPDDYGHDPELPVVLQALGLISAAFWRIPGAAVHNANRDQSLLDEMQKNGLDFFWQASDGSQVFAHWLVGGYPLGNMGQGVTGPTTAQIQSYLQDYGMGVTPSFNYACTPYLYVPNDYDFQMPNTYLVKALGQWNSTGYTTGTYAGVYAVQASFDDFVSLAMFHNANMKTQPFNAQPYWTGYYASQMAMKTLHYAATRNLLAAEVFGLLAAPGDALCASFWSDVSQAWNDFVPSTHHDYITGTGASYGSTYEPPQPDVYNLEQLPNLTYASAEASQVAKSALMALALSVPVTDPSSPGSGEVPVVIANSAGVPFSGLVELPGPVPSGKHGVQAGGVVGPVQASGEGGLVFLASVPSLGYSTVSLIPSAPASPVSSPASIHTTHNGATYTLSNTLLTVTVSQSAAWGITSITDSQGNSLLASGKVGNSLTFYQDSGDIYDFGNDYAGLPPPSSYVFDAETPKSTNSGTAQVLESGPLRVRLQTSITVATQLGLAPQTYFLEYCLVVGEPFLRMTTTGAAPAVSLKANGKGLVVGYSIMTAFPLAQDVNAIVHGTACHWTSAQPLNTWPAPIFQATHRFLLPQAGSTTLAAIYHPEVPAWSFDGNGTLIGCLFRNTPSNGPHGAGAVDTAIHVLHYALRTSYGLNDPSTGQPLAEALNYTQPAVAMLVPTTTSGQLPGTSSIAAVTGGTGAILAAKPGDVTPGTLILRLYQPNVTPSGPQSLTVTLGAGQPASVIAVTALEDEVAEGGPTIALTSDGFTITASTALNTVQITPAAT